MMLSFIPFGWSVIRVKATKRVGSCMSLRLKYFNQNICDSMRKIFVKYDCYVMF